MNRRFVLSVGVIFVVSMLTDFVIHGLLLGADYARMAGSLFRAEQDSQQYFGWMLLAHVFIAAAFVWIYLQGRDANKPALMQGLRFGVAVSALAAVPGYLIYYAVQPMPGLMVAQQIVFSVVALLIMGMVVAALNRN